MTVSELNLLAKKNVEASFSTVWVEGEISNFKHHVSGHMYFTLKDKRCQLRCVMFRGANQRLKFTPADGQGVTARGGLTIYEVQGSFQLNVTALEPAGAGDLRAAFEKLKQQLAAAGLFDQARKQKLPRLPQAVGVITAPGGAAIRDILHVFASRGPGLPVIIYGVPVQGTGAADKIAGAINEMNRLAEVDVLIVGRGGGSLEDLWPFNEEVVARAIADSRLPIISAVGHEIDFSISDMAADLRCPTPTAAAEAVCDGIEELRWELRQTKGRLAGSVAHLVELARARMSEARPERLSQAWQRYLESRSRELDGMIEALVVAPGALLKEQAYSLAGLRSRLAPLGPEDVLRRGYSITTRSADGSIVMDGSSVAAGEALSVRLHKGKLEVEIKKK
jgi:exodeoxyribonuclease VII large subunit